MSSFKKEIYQFHTSEHYYLLLKLLNWPYADPMNQNTKRLES